jgi:hypothetical protein
MKKVKHVGFKGAAKAAAKSAAARGKPLRDPGAVIAAGARKASPAAVKRNPRLKKVSGVGKKGR